MLVPMKRQVFDSSDPAALVWECIGPILLPLRGKHPLVKSQVYAQLTAGQQALFAVQVFQNHAGEEASDLYYWASTLLRDPQTWRAIKAGVRYFGDETMFHLLEQLENVLEARLQQGCQGQLPFDPFRQRKVTHPRVFLPVLPVEMGKVSRRPGQRHPH